MVYFLEMGDCFSCEIEREREACTGRRRDYSCMEAEKKLIIQIGDRATENKREYYYFYFIQQSNPKGKTEFKACCSGKQQAEDSPQRTYYE